MPPVERIEYHWATRSQPLSIRRSSRKFSSKLEKVELIKLRECGLADPVLLTVVMLAQADRPFV